MSTSYTEYEFPGAREPHMFSQFMPVILDLLGNIPAGTRVLDVGCGNGYVCGEFARRGATVTGIDLSRQGLQFAREAHPQVRFEEVSADDQILENLHEQPFDIVVSTEVVEHLHSPASWARGCFAAVKPGGVFICTTPYHGYLKNLLISLAGNGTPTPTRSGKAATSSSGAGKPCNSFCGRPASPTWSFAAPGGCPISG